MRWQMATIGKAWVQGEPEGMGGHGADDRGHAGVDAGSSNLAPTSANFVRNRCNRHGLTFDMP